MAKLNVKVIGEVIEWNGEQYRKVEREAAVDDVVKFLGTFSEDTTVGSFYEIIGVDEDDEAYFKDDVGDTSYFENYCVEVYEKITESTESSDLFTYEGTQYRKVNRDPVAGDYVLVTNSDFSHLNEYENGDVLKLNHVDSVKDGHYGRGKCIYRREFTVLEPTGVTKSVDTPNPGTTVQVTESTYKPGNKVRFVNTRSINGRVETLKARNPKCDNYGRGLAWLTEESLGWIGENEFELYVEETKPARVPIGTIVKITNGGNNDGKLAKVAKDDLSIIPYKCETLNGEFLEWCAEIEFEVLSEADAKAAVEAESVRQKWAAIGRKVGEYRVGDIVGVTAGYGSDQEGDIGVITIADGTNCPGVTVRSSERYCYVKLITPVEQRFDSDSRFDKFGAVAND